MITMKYTTITYIDFSNLYEKEAELAFERYDGNGAGVRRLDVSDIRGTNCYCDDDAADQLRNVLRDEKPEGIHYMDSGNYHYVSLFYLEKIKYDFGLVLFDNHPDIQESAFGGILSCGGWVRRALESISNLKQVIMIGVDSGHINEVSPLPDKIKVVSDLSDMEIYEGLPLYISLDKDALSSGYAACDWDQGKMELAELLKL